MKLNAAEYEEGLRYAFVLTETDTSPIGNCLKRQGFLGPGEKILIGPKLSAFGDGKEVAIYRTSPGLYQVLRTWYETGEWRDPPGAYEFAAI